VKFSTKRKRRKRKLGSIFARKKQKQNSKILPNFLFGGKNNKICQGKKCTVHHS
jgi:hypothetical protein